MTANNEKKVPLNLGLAGSNEEILKSLENIDDKINILFMNNKKFMMTASMKQNEDLKRKIKSMRMEAINILDGIDIIVSAVYNRVDSETKAGIDITMNNIRKSLHELGIEEIEVRIGDRFDPSIHKCVETVTDSEYLDDIVTGIVKRGYIDKVQNIVIRPAEVIICKK